VWIYGLERPAQKVNQYGTYGFRRIDSDAVISSNTYRWILCIETRCDFIHLPEVTHMVFALVSTATVLAFGLVAYVVHIWRNTAS